MSDRVLAAVKEAPHSADRRAARVPGARSAGQRGEHFLRALGLLERHADHVPWDAIGSQRYGLHSLNQALGDAAAMRLTRELVGPWRS